MNLASTLEKERIEMAWWVEIFTEEPCCTYYFGPFESKKEVVLAQPGYIEDLINEGSQGITVEVKWCKPRELTILFEDKLAEVLSVGYLSLESSQRA